MAEKEHQPNGIGLGVDAGGGPVIDPTANVKALTNASNKRQDDLRSAFEKYQEKEINNIKEIVGLRSGYEKEISALRSHYDSRLSEAESKRIDAIRAVDVQASAVDREKQTASAAVLANQVSISADALRTLVSTTASTIAEQSRIQMVQITDRLTAVERSQYEGRGKAGMAEPMLAEMVLEMKSLRQSISTSGGKSEGGQDVWKFIALGVSLLAMTTGAVFTIVNFGGAP